MNLALVIPASLIVFGAYLILTSLGAGDVARPFGGLVDVPATFATFFGGLAILGGLVVGFEMLWGKKSRLAGNVAPLVSRNPDRDRPPGKS